MDVFTAAVDAIFADPNVARDAIWRAGGAGSGISVRVVTRRPDQIVGFGDSRAILPTVLIEVRRSEVSEPRAGDTVEIPGSSPGTGDLFEIIAAATLDSLRLLWTCEGVPAA